MRHLTISESYKKIQTVSGFKKISETAIKIKDDFAEAYGNLGNTLFELRLFDEAQESLKAVKIRPGLADAHYNLGRATQELGEIEGRAPL